MGVLKDKVINGIIAREGGYVNNPNDSGGETCWGITVAVARANGYSGPMRLMPKEAAFKIYVKKYWDINSLDAVEILSPLIAEELADTGVNQGVGTAGKFLQRSLNALNNRQKYYPDVKVDGQIGPGTVGKLQAYLKLRGKEGEKVLFKMLNSLQGAAYVSLSEAREKDEEFIFGWFSNRVS